VKASIEVGLALDACGGQLGPRILVGLLNRAADTVDRSAAAHNPGQADQLMTVAVRRLAVLARRAAAAAKRGRVSLECTAALDPVLSTAESRGECLASRRPPVADTYIEARGASKNHGGAPELDVDGSPQRITYLKFDLSAVPGRVHKAVLDLRSIRSSVDAGAVYRIPDSSWSEGSGNDTDPSTAHGVGLTWKQVDTNGDKTLDTSDGSPFVPQKSAPVVRVGRVASGQVVHLNVTRAVQSGAGLYTLAIMSSNSDGTAFASREEPTAKWRPVLRIVR